MVFHQTEIEVGAEDALNVASNARSYTAGKSVDAYWFGTTACEKRFNL